jgi:DNA-binding beta-propeller fold protein YncE
MGNINLKDIIEETIRKEVKRAILENTDSKEVYIIKNKEGEPIEVCQTQEEAEEKKLGYSIPKTVSPSHISLDGERNIWVSLHDTLSVLKFSPMGEFLFATTPIKIKEDVPTNVYNWFIENSYYPTTVNDYDQRLIEPTGIETDKDNNLWVSYSNYLSGFVTKINKDGNLLLTINSPVCSCPQEIISDIAGNVWICNNANIWGTFGSIQKRSSTGALLSTFKGIRSPNYLTLDMDQNLWFSYGYNKIGYIDNITSNTLTYTVSGTSLCLAGDIYADYPKSNIPFSNKYPSETPWFDENKNVDETAIEGIACDMRNYLYVINSIENMVYVFDTTQRKTIDNFYISPQGYFFYSEDQLKSTKMKYYEWNRSLQATGDWTGSRWVNKYGEIYLDFYTRTTKSFYISGISDKLNFYDRSVYTAFKINEDFDLADNMKQFAKMPILQKSPFLFDDFLGNMFGKKPFYQDDLGVVAYEKISNFVLNNSDPETCEIPQLYNLSKMINSESEDLLLNYPPSIKRIMGFASINISKLIGSNCNCGNSFERINDCAKIDICPYCKKEKKNNRGNLIESLNYTITAGIPVVLKAKAIKNYKLIYTGIVQGNTQYELNDLASSLGLTDDWTQHYEFYEYIPYWNGGIIENVIDWNSDQTTISRMLSTNDDWYKDEGLLDIFFNYELYKGLGLLDD